MATVLPTRAAFRYNRGPRIWLACSRTSPKNDPPPFCVRPFPVQTCGKGNLNARRIFFFWKNEEKKLKAPLI
jgi:hypothetical protein